MVPLFGASGSTPVGARETPSASLKPGPLGFPGPATGPVAQTWLVDCDRALVVRLHRLHGIRRNSALLLIFVDETDDLAPPRLRSS